MDESIEGASAGHVRVGERYYPVTVETVSVDVAAGVARHLAPVVDAGVHVDDDSDLPRAISYLKLGGMAMAQHFRRMTGIDPLTIEQTMLVPHDKPTSDHPYRRDIVRVLKPRL